MIRMFLFAMQLRSHGTCPADTYVANVRPDGVYSCRQRLPSFEPADELRHGVIVDDHARETTDRIRCRDGERAIWMGVHDVGCAAK